MKKQASETPSIYDAPTKQPQEETPTYSEDSSYLQMVQEYYENERRKAQAKMEAKMRVQNEQIQLSRYSSSADGEGYKDFRSLIGRSQEPSLYVHQNQPTQASKPAPKPDLSKKFSSQSAVTKLTEVSENKDVFNLVIGFKYEGYDE